MDGPIGRREFVRMAAAGVALPGCLLGAAPQTAAVGPAPDPAERELVMAALDAAKSSGVAYADARISRNFLEFITTRERQITGVMKTDSYGIGIRALVGGSWGFAATRDVTRDAVVRAAREAAATARTNNAVAPAKTILAPARRVRDGRWATPHDIDPFSISVEQKADLLFKVNESALKVKGVRFVFSSIFFIKETRLVANTDGSLIQQTFVRIGPEINVTAVSSDNSDSQSRRAAIGPAGAGWEYVTGLDLPENVIRWSEEAVMKLSAPPVEPGSWDLVLDPSHLWLTIHESIAHPTELDRALGYEANYAGTTYLSPPEKVLRKFKMGPEFMTVVANRTEPKACATVGWDDEGIPARSWPVILNGLFVNYHSATREMVHWTSPYTNIKESPGCAYGEDWSSISFPRMPNVSLMPATTAVTTEEILSATKRGIYIEGDGSYSIDQQRYNFQFGGQIFWEIRDGKKTRMLRDVAYVGRSPEFWNSLAMIGGPSTYRMGGTIADGKGQPPQSNAVSHGCPMALFRGANIIRTA